MQKHSSLEESGGYRCVAVIIIVVCVLLTRKQIVTSRVGPKAQCWRIMFGRWVNEDLGGLDVSVQSEQWSYSRLPRAEAAALQDIGLLRAWNANAIPDEPNRSGLTNRPHDYRHVGWLGVGGGGCLQQSAGKVLAK